MMRAKENKKQREIRETTNLCSDLIKRAYDIDLTLAEYLILRNYVASFSDLEKRKVIGGVQGDATHLFMLDYFGIDIFELREDVVELDKWGQMRARDYGLGLVSRVYYISDDRLKEYCRNHVQEWREQRELI